VGYLKIKNLYQDKDILAFKECYAMEKVHGTSAHIKWDTRDQELTFYHGGATRELFVALFNKVALIEFFKAHDKNITIYGEAYGGKLQRMNETYGTKLRFIAFEVKINGTWLQVPIAEKYVLDAGLEFMPYNKIDTSIESINAERDRESIVAIRNGMGKGKKREGVVLRSLLKPNPSPYTKRLIVKHKADDFRETKTPRIISYEELKVLSDAKEIAEEWVTRQRLNHVLDKMDNVNIADTKQVITNMWEDVYAESEGEIEYSRAAVLAIHKATARMFKDKLKEELTI